MPALSQMIRFTQEEHLNFGLLEGPKVKSDGRTHEAPDIILLDTFSHSS